MLKTWCLKRRINCQKSCRSPVARSIAKPHIRWYQVCMTGLVPMFLRQCTALCALQGLCHGPVLCVLPLTIGTKTVHFPFYGHTHILRSPGRKHEPLPAKVGGLVLQFRAVSEALARRVLLPNDIQDISKSEARQGPQTRMGRRRWHCRRHEGVALCRPSGQLFCLLRCLLPAGSGCG